METGENIGAHETRADETRLRIFENTLRLVETDGVTGLTIRQIAEKSSVSPALIIQYFTSKGRLLFKVYEYVNADLPEQIRALAPGIAEGDIKAVLLNVTRLFLTRAFGRKDLTRHIMSLSYTWNSDEETIFRDWLQPVQSEIAALLMKADASLDLVDAQAYALLCFIEFTQYYRAGVNSGWTAEETVTKCERLIHVLAQGIRFRNA